MAERDSDMRARRANLVRGQARTLIEALEAVEVRRRGHQISMGRAGVTPRNWVGAGRHEENTTTCSRQEVSQMPRGRIGAFKQPEPHPGGLLMRRGRGQGLVINITILTCMSQHPTEGRGRGRALAPPSPHPLKITPRLGGAMMALSDASRQCPGVSGPMAIFHVLPNTPFVTQMPPTL